MTPEIINRDEFIVVGVRAVLEMGAQTTGDLWKNQFLPRQNDIHGADHLYYSVFNVLPDDHKSGRVECVAGVLGSLEDIPEGMVGWVIPDGRYARIQAAGLAGISAACRKLLADWLPDSGFTRVDGPIFACTRDKRPDSTDAVWVINIPVETPEEIERLSKWHAVAEN